MIVQLFLLAVLLVCSGVISGSETALFGLSRAELRGFQATGGALRRRAWQLMQRPRRVLMTVLIANTTINVAFFAISFLTFEQLGEQHALAASAGGVGALLAVILFGEIIPKAVAQAHAARVAPFAAPLVHTLALAFWPLRVVLRTVLVEPLTRLLSPTLAESDDVSADELRALVEMSAHGGVIDSAESRMLQEIVSLPEISVRAVMRPRVDVVALPLSADTLAMKERMRSVRLTKLPVYGRDLDDIRGLIYARDLYLRAREPVERLIRPIHYIPEQANLLQLIEHFRLTRSQLAIVVDEFGGTAGLVSVNDVLERIVGGLHGGGAPDQPATVAVDENTYRLAGNLDIRSWIERFGVGGEAGGRIARSGVETVAGLVLAELGRFPREGDTVCIQNLELTVNSMTGRRIDWILLRRSRAASGPNAPPPAPQETRR